jgi:hypothetical protein
VADELDELTVEELDELIAESNGLDVMATATPMIRLLLL